IQPPFANVKKSSPGRTLRSSPVSSIGCALAIAGSGWAVGVVGQHAAIAIANQALDIDRSLHRSARCDSDALRIWAYQHARNASVAVLATWRRARGVHCRVSNDA